MRIPIIKAKSVLVLGLAITLISGTAGSARNFAAVPETELGAEGLPQTARQGEVPTGTITESSLMTDQKGQDPLRDREGTLLLHELQKAMQQTKSTPTNLEQYPSLPIPGIKQTATEEERILSILTWIRQGRDPYAANNIAMALGNLHQAERQHPIPGKLMGLLSLAYGEMGYYSKALECARNAAAQEPKEYWAQLALGISNAQLGNYENAITALQAAAALEPQNKEPHFFLAECFLAMKQSPEAEKHQKLYQELDAKSAVSEESNAKINQSPIAETPRESTQKDLTEDVPITKEPSVPKPEETMPGSTQKEPVRLQMQEL